MGMTLGRCIGANVLNAAEGGTGYVASANPFGSAVRVAAVAAFEPELIVFIGSLNDDGAAGIAAAATDTFDAYRAACPNVPMIVFGPQPSSATATVAAARASNIAAVKSAAESHPAVLAFFDMVGTGDSGAAPDAFSTYETVDDGDLRAYQGSVYEWSGGNAASTGPYAPLVQTKWAPRTWAYTGTGKVGATTSDGSRDTFLANDAVHPTVDGAIALTTGVAAGIGRVLASA